MPKATGRKPKNVTRELHLKPGKDATGIKHSTRSRLGKLADQMSHVEAIATQLGVHHSQIVRDLKEFVHDAQIKPAKTSTNPKGAGRPKGNR